MNNYCTTYDTATIDQQPEESDRERILEAYENDESSPERLVEFLGTLPSRPSSPTEAAEQPLDFEALRYVIEWLPTVAPSRFTSEDDTNYDRLARDLPRLIDMAERWQEAEAERDVLKSKFEQAAKDTSWLNRLCDGQIARIGELESERDKLRTQTDQFREAADCPPDYNLDQWARTLAALWHRTEGGTAFDALNAERNRLKANEKEHQALIDKIAWVRREVFPNKPCELRGALLELQDEIFRLRAERGPDKKYLPDEEQPSGLSEEENRLFCRCRELAVACGLPEEKQQLQTFMNDLGSRL